MKPVIPLTRGHVVGLVKYVAEQLGKGSETKLPRGLVDSCIRAGATAAENAIEAAVNDALAPKSPGYYVPQDRIPQAIAAQSSPVERRNLFGDATLLPELPSSTCGAPTIDEPLSTSAAVAFLQELKTPTTEICPVAAKAVAMADAAIAPLQPAGESAEVEGDNQFSNDGAPDFDEPDFDETPFPADAMVVEHIEDGKQLLSVEAFIAVRGLRIVKPATPAGEWFCCRGDLDDSVLGSKPAAEAAIRQGIIVGGNCKADAVEKYASLNGLSFYA